MLHKLFLLTFFLALYSTPALAAPDSPAQRGALGQMKIEAAELLRQGDGEAANELYRRLIRELPQDDEVLLGLARSATGVRRWNQAVMAYEILLEKYPQLAGLYSELAHVYMLLGEREAAERSLAMVRSLGGEGDSARLDLLEQMYDQFQVHGKIRAGVMYDSNVNMGPESDLLILGNWLVNIPGAESRDSAGAYLGFDLDLSWRPLRDSGWWLVSDVRGLWRGYADSALHDDLHARESQWGRAGVGARYVGSKFLLDARVKTEIFDYEAWQQVLALGPEFTLVYAPTSYLHLLSAAGWDQRFYSKAGERDGGYGWAGEYARLFFGEDNHEIMLGGRFLWGEAQFDDYSYLGWEGSLRLLFKLPFALELSPFLSLTQEHYNGPATILEGKDRLDTRWRMGAALTWRVSESWSWELSYQYMDNDSVSSLYDYNQHLLSSGVAWSF
jgi:tetratricopeptide (TPR) repeat protein